VLADVAMFQAAISKCGMQTRVFSTWQCFEPDDLLVILIDFTLELLHNKLAEVVISELHTATGRSTR
jgi:hypothetical protein